MGLEGLVSHRDSAYRAGLFDRWVKNKNRVRSAFGISSAKELSRTLGTISIVLRRFEGQSGQTG